MTGAPRVLSPKEQGAGSFFCQPGQQQETMNKDLKKIFVFGFPGSYGGAVTEMHHQILLWRRMGMAVHLIPAWSPKEEPLYPAMRELGVIIHPPLDWSALSPEDAIMGFCSQLFLSYLPDILPYTRRTVSLGCMTWLQGEEKRAMRDGEIALFLFQNEEIKQLIQPQLQALNPHSGARFMTFRPYFHEQDFPFHEKRSADTFCCGHISRMDCEKYAKETISIYETFSSPLPKKGIFLGFYDHVEEKTGPPPPWIKTAQSHEKFPIADFYRQCDIILQPSDTTENWPRVGFEAMSSGSVLIVDNRGGWRQMVEHGKTGWLCDTPQDFIRCASLMAHEPALRRNMAHAARQQGRLLGGWATAKESWKAVFAEIASLPL